MKTMIQLFISLVVIAAVHLVSFEAHANQCSSLFRSDEKPGKISINAMAEPDLGSGIKADAEVVARVALELGLETPAHQINILPSGQLDILAASGGHTAPHWHDGAGLLASGASVRGVLEFVTKGCPTCRAYYSASTPRAEQRSVVMHVAGHNDMSSTSRYQTIRPGDAPLASFQLAEALTKAYGQNHRDSVSLYYQFLKSFGQLQDYAYGTFESPSKFSEKAAQSQFKPAAEKSLWESLVPAEGGFFENLVAGARPNAPGNDVKWTKTYSVLQAMTENLPPQAPEWQRTLIRLYEQSHRAYPSVFQTKIMNEGWATLMQYILARHLPWTTSADLVKYAQLMSGVAYPSFENPYWLGVSGWMNLYEQFVARPDIRGLAEKEKDRQFIKYARELYRDKNDSEWAKIALDQRWIEKNNFFLYRETREEEMDPNVDPEKQNFIALSRDWKRVRNFIISQYVDVKYRQIPSIMLINPHTTQGVFKLVQDMSEGIPLEITTATKTLFVMAQVLQKPVEIDALLNRSMFDAQEQGARAELDAHLKKQGRPDGTLLATIHVSPSGEVKFILEGNSLPPTAKQLEEIINQYKTDVLGTFRQDMTDFQIRQWTTLATKVSEDQSTAASVNNIVEYAPYTGPAIRDYLQVVEKRLRAAVLASLKGQGGSNVKVGPGGITLPVLPEVPEFHYDRRVIAERIMNQPPGPVDSASTRMDLDFHADANGSKIGAGPKLPGDKWSPKKKQQQGEGEGEGQGEGEGPGQEGKGKGKKPGEGEEPGEDPSPGSGGGSGNPTDLKIPLKLYGELLEGIFDLPNIRRTNGKVPETQTIRRGTLRKPTGNVLWDSTMVAAMDKARAIRRGKGLPYDSSVPVMDLIREALPLIEPADIRVSGRMEKPLPDFDAVLVVNVDLTGSMAGERIEAAKNLIYNIKALLLAKYKDVKIVYVGFDSTARELSEKEIFSQFFGGGTAYESAAQLSREILTGDRFPSSRYNKYVLTIGDAETSQADAQGYVKIINEIKDELQYAGLAVTNERMDGMVEALVNGHTQLKGEWPWVGVAQLRHRGDMFDAIRKLFLGDQKEE